MIVMRRRPALYAIEAGTVEPDALRSCTVVPLTFAASRPRSIVGATLAETLFARDAGCASSTQAGSSEGSTPEFCTRIDMPEPGRDQRIVGAVTVEITDCECLGVVGIAEVVDVGGLLRVERARGIRLAQPTERGRSGSRWARSRAG